jgi:alpha-L-rhamnosidase
MSTCLRLLALFALAASSLSAASQLGPTHPRVDNLSNPLGLDDPAPRFSWQLHDPARGAKQTAYQITVSSSREGLLAGKADVWDSGRVPSSQSLEIPYAGPPLSASTRYYWQVKVWSASGRAYTPTSTAWWETGLMTESAKNQNWTASWIGYETTEESAVRDAQAQWIMNPDAQTLATEKGAEQHFAYRTTIQLAKPIRSAALFATAQDTVSAWINGKQVLTAAPLPPWKATPWRKFLRADVTHALASGANTLSIESVYYVLDPRTAHAGNAPPLIATLFVQFADGTTATFSTSPDWKTAIHPSAGWQQPGFDDHAWKSALRFKPANPGHSADPSQSADLGNPWIPDSVKALRRDFAVSAPIKSARLYATALGAYEMFLNGARIGNQILAPGWTDFRDHVYYQTYDVTAQVAQGRNVLGALLAPGWYATALTWDQQPNNYGATPPALRAELRIEHTDGSVQWIATDASWWANISDIAHSEIYDGESQNDQGQKAGHPAIGSFSTGVLARAWPHAIAIDPAPVRILAQDFQPITVERTLEAKALTQPKPGVFVYDFGQNFSGQERLRVTGPDGTNVRLRFAEVLNPDGTLYTENLRTAKATDHFSLRSSTQPGQAGDFTAQFTFHGFRYAELTGRPGTPAKDAVTANVIHTDAPFTVQLKTGSSLINQLWSNVLWGQRSNFVGLPTDCPQRDERLGWMGDAQVFWRAASYNMDLAAFSRKFAADMRSTQVGSPYYGIYSPGTSQPNAGSAAGWSDAGIIVPYTSWLQTGDTAIIQENWAAMTAYLDAIHAANPGYLWKNHYGAPFGDWLSPEGKTDEVLIASAYWAWDATLMHQMALATGRTADAEKYAQLFSQIRSAFDAQFVHSDGFIAGADNSASTFGQLNNPDAKSHGGDTQTGYVLALHMNLLPENLRAAAARHLAAKIHANHDLLGTGFLGTPYLLEELTGAGYAQLAYTLLLNTRYPSWGYMVAHGATTTWERWNGDRMRDDPSMNSYNHYAYGAVADWIYRYAAGIDATPADPGFHTVVLHPVFDARLSPLSLDYESPSGPIHSDWQIANGTATWHITLPANTTGLLDLIPSDTAKYKLNGAPLSGNPLVQSVTHDGENNLTLASGSYTFEVQVEHIAHTSISNTH